mmetsp:Transcript_38532/g.89170  ORF Transcript_38532/g.89170 Transcript_38532/m.89170 type:complete len:85 (+) Transcript_38532:72-326(+)
MELPLIDFTLCRSLFCRLWLEWIPSVFVGRGLEAASATVAGLRFWTGPLSVAAYEGLHETEVPACDAGKDQLALAEEFSVVAVM